MPLAMPVPKKRLLVGASGRGKTYLGMELVADETRLIVADFIADPGADGWENSCVVVTHWDALYRELEHRKFRIAVQIDEEPAEVLDRLCRIVRTYDRFGNQAVGPCTLVIEEPSIPIENPRAKPSLPLSSLIRFSRREGVSWMVLTQQYSDVPTLVRRHCSDHIIFQTTERADLAELRDTYGARVARMVKRLPAHSYLHFRRDRVTPGMVVDANGNRTPIADDDDDQELDHEMGLGRGDRSGDRLGDQRSRSASLARDGEELDHGVRETRGVRGAGDRRGVALRARSKGRLREGDQAGGDVDEGEEQGSRAHPGRGGRVRAGNARS